MPKTMRLLQILGFVILGFPFGVPSAVAEVEQGDIAPALKVTELDGSKFDLASLKGKVVVIDMWATWCGACREEMPELSAFYQLNHSKGIEVLALSVDGPHDRSEVAEVAKAFHLPTAMVNDAKDSGFGVPALIPTTYIVDSNGMVQNKLIPDQVSVSVASLTAATLPLLPGASSAGHSK